MALYDVFYQSTPIWFPGAIIDSKTKLVSLETQPLGPDDHYPGDYKGIVSGVVEPNEDGSPRGSWSSRIRMELTKEQVCQLKSRTHKIESGEIVPVTVMDRVGQRVYTELQKINPDVAKWEADEKARLEAANPEDGPPISTFDEAVAKASEKLPQTVVNTGTGLYAVKVVPTKNDDTQLGAPAGQVITLTVGGLGILDVFKGGYVTNVTRAETRAIVSHTDNTVTLEGSLAAWINGDDLDIYDAYATGQAACDALWTDQAAAAFTSSQYIRFYSGTYLGTVTLNANLNPEPVFGFRLILEGDPSVARSAIVIDGNGGTNTFNINCDDAVVRHITLTGTTTSWFLFFGTGHITATLDDCSLTLNGATNSIYIYRALLATDCAFTINKSLGLVAYPGYAGGGSRFLRCTFTGPGKAVAGLAPCIGSTISTVICDSCLFNGMGYAVAVYAGETSQCSVLLRNCTIYNCTYSAYVQGSNVDGLIMQNCIVSECSTALRVVPWPEESSTAYGTSVTLHNNVFHNYTNFAYNDAAYKTYADFIAFAHVDTANNLFADPLFTTPGTDFTLQLASPCHHAGAGAGVPYDIAGDEFDPYRPDMGAYSTGVWPGQG